MTRPSLCCCLSGCEDAQTLKDQIYAKPLGDWACTFSGAISLKSAVAGGSLTYQNVFLEGCQSDACCLTCGGTAFDCYTYCEPPHPERTAACAAIHSPGSRRKFLYANGANYCPECESEPYLECDGCDGWPDTEFTTTGFDSRASLPIGTSLPCDGFVTVTTYVIASKVEIFTSGSQVLTTKKELSVRISTSAQRPVFPNCLVMKLKFQIVGAVDWEAPCENTDTLLQKLEYVSIWNGTDNMAQFLAHPMTLQYLSWDYDICPDHHAPYGYTTCGAWDLDTFVDAQCGWCSATGYTMDYKYETYGLVKLDYVCPPLTLSPIIDADWQPWQDVAATIDPL